MVNSQWFQTGLNFLSTASNCSVAHRLICMTLVPLKAKCQWNQAASSLEIHVLLNGYHN